MLRSASRETKTADSGTKRVPAERESRFRPLHSPNGNGSKGWVHTSSAEHPLAAIHRAFGNQAVLRSLSPRRPTIQTKLTINTPGNQYEQEADRVAEQVMRMPDPNVAAPTAIASTSPVLQRKCASGGSGVGGGRCSECAKKDELQRTAAGPVSTPAAPPIVHDVLRQPGTPLDASTRAFFEPRFGHDFGSVRVHADDVAAESALSVNSLAYTVGGDIVFAAGLYAPDNSQGRRLLAHELAHTFQQRDTTMLQRLGPYFPQPQPNPVPGLGPRPAQDTDDMIKAGDFQGAIDMVLFYAHFGIDRNPSIDDNLLAQRTMTYDPKLTVDGLTSNPTWNYINNRADPPTVRIGPGAFSSVSYLYSVIMHEYQHVLFQQSVSNQTLSQQARGHGGMDTEETEASAWEILHAQETGLEHMPDEIAQIWKTLNGEFWQLDAAAQANTRPLAMRALTEAQRFVRGSQVSLVPFSP